MSDKFIEFSIQNHSNNSPIYFRIPSTAPIRKAIDAFCSREGNQNFYLFCLKDQAIDPEAYGMSPLQLDLHNGDTITALPLE